ncbi:MAG: type II secretion system F family protein [Dehalococcoidales bacterium]|nr:type II secretion system F family protein [Dehalococcoidales bacterium]
MLPPAVLLIVVPILAFVTIALFAFALAAPRRSELQERLKAYGYDVKALSGGDLAEPFSARILAPIGGMLPRLVRSLAPEAMREQALARLEQAGRPMSVNRFLTARFLAMLALPTIVLLPRLLARDVGMQQFIIAVALLYIGNRLPDIWLSFQIDARRALVRKALPDALDLIVVCVEAGYGLEAAIAKVAERTSGPLTEEFRRALAEIRLGKPRREALHDLSTRLGEPDVQSFIAAIVQADQMGVSIAQVLRVQADAVRVRRQQRAEEKALQAPVKMLFPMFLFIFPVLMIVILAPAAIKISAFFAQMVAR